MGFDDTLRIHRAMREQRAEALERGILAVLDLGTTKTSCLVLEFKERENGFVMNGARAGRSNFRVIGVASAKSRGLRFGEIDSIAEASGTIRTVLTKAQKQAGERVDHLVVCFSGARPESSVHLGKVELGENQIEETDIARVLAACDVPHPGGVREAIHAQPVNFSVDHRTGLLDPRGHRGNLLMADLHMLSVDRHMLEHVSECADDCRVELAGVASAAYVSGISSLVEDEQELGAACVDIGGGVTGVSIFFRKHMLFAEAIPVAGNDVTSDISSAFSVSTRVAERLKVKYGGVKATSRDDLKQCHVAEMNGWAGPESRITRAQLIAVIKPRVEEILEHVKATLDCSEFDKLDGNSVVLTGGSSALPGLEELAKEMLGRHVRFGRPIRLPGIPVELSGPEYSSAAGLSLLAAQPQDEWWDFADPKNAAANSRPVGKIFSWIRKNW